MAVVEERVAALESQVNGISKLDDKMDQKMDALTKLVTDIKDVMINQLMPRDECKLRCQVCDKKFANTNKWQKILVGALVSGTVSLILWLLEMLFKYHIAITSSAG